jgi:SAM-dependent methyltransferase
LAALSRRKLYSLTVQLQTLPDIGTRTLSVPPCPACTGTSFRKLFTRKGRDFWRCRGCGLERLQPLPTLEELAAYYDGSYQQGMYKAFVDAGDMKVRTARWRLAAVRRHLRPGRWLDVGCANGVFVGEALRHGNRTEGIDLSAVAVDEGRARGLPLARATIAEWSPPHRYDAITAFDVLEHVLDPVGFLERARELLEPGGSIAISVPNLASWSRRLMGRRWYFYIPEEHLHYFRPRTLDRLLGRCGFTTRWRGPAWKPLTFDYSLRQFQEYNPLIHRVLDLVRRLLPRRAREMAVPLPIGEMLVIACKEERVHGGTG